MLSKKGIVICLIHSPYIFHTLREGFQKKQKNTSSAKLTSDQSPFSESPSSWSSSTVMLKFSKLSPMFKLPLEWSLLIRSFYYQTCQQTRCNRACSKNSFVIHSLSNRSFSFRYAQHKHKSQTVRARKLKFWENVHPATCVLCHLSPVICHVSCVMCHLSPAAKKNPFSFSYKKIPHTGDTESLDRDRDVAWYIFKSILKFRWFLSKKKKKC